MDAVTAVDDGTAVTVEERWTYVHAARKKPYLHPVLTPSGHCLTRVEPEDHPWHRGIWFTIKHVDGDNFWEEMPPYGVLRHDGPPSVDGDTVSGALTWTRPDRETVAMTEHRSLAHVDLGGDAYGIDVEIVLTPMADTVLDRTEFTTWGGYGGLSLRGRPDWTDTRLLLADSSEHQRLLGVPSTWCDLSGTVDAASGATGGIAFLDHPGNPRHPVPWYGSTRAATYGDEGWSNFLNAAFLFHEPLGAPAGDPLRFRYRLAVHDGIWDHARAAAAYDQWVTTDG
jgi:hypothetical protein